jgi:hypothetical protein
MIPTLDTTQINLGKDRERISAHDAARQAATVDHILRAFFGPASERRELQMLADEVGMGKTYVALAAAYTILSILRDTTRCQELDDVANCYRCVLVITPGGNATLAQKWDREDDALLTRCAVTPEKSKWFHSVLCESADELLQAIYRANDLRRRNEPVILVAQSNIFTKRLSDPAVRFVTACLFRWWGNGLQMRERYHLVRGLSDTVGSWGWEDAAQWAGRGEYEVDLWDWGRHERFLSSSEQERSDWEPRWQRHLFASVSVTYADMETALNRFARNGGQAQLDQLRLECKNVPLKRPGDRRTIEYAAWSKTFRDLKASLREVFKQLWPHLLDRRFPLVIADEAHHWRNNDAGEFRSIRNFIAPFARRVLLLTATPFQLHPQETVSILNVVDHMEPAIGKDRVAALQRMRDRLATCMEASERAGRAFSREWGALPDQLAQGASHVSDIAVALGDEEDPRTEKVGELWATLAANVHMLARPSLAQIPGLIRPFFTRAIELRQANQALQDAMRPLVIRHRRSNVHRRFWVGREYPPTDRSVLRPDHSLLHLAPGQSLEPKEELVQYLLMKVVATLSRGRHRTALGTALTGCYTTMWESKEGRKAIAAAATGDQQGLMHLLQRLTGSTNKARDSEHPKLRRVVESLLERWDRGEKSLVFCFRVPTAEALYTTLSGRIEERLHKKRLALFKARGTEIATDQDRDRAMQQFRRSLTARESSGVPLFLDRVLMGWFLQVGCRVPVLTHDDVSALAALAARAQVKGRPLFRDAERLDRVFLARAIEHVWARRLVRTTSDLPRDRELRRLTTELQGQMADEAWVRDRYGRRDLSTGSDWNDDEATERAARSSLAAHYDLASQPEPALLTRLTKGLLSRFQSGHGSVFATLVDGPNLFSPSRSAMMALEAHSRSVAESLRGALFAITQRESQWDWEARRDAVDALVRALLRDDILLRMPARVFSGQDDTWAASLFAGLHQPFGASEGETLAQRVVEFLQEMGRMGAKERQSYLEYAMNPKAEAVALVKGLTKSRPAVFAGFNTPLLPEILVCTSVGQEGIDLHRECRHVIHYDLGWNPASIEQRTGRVDRIGSKAERERTLALGQHLHRPERNMPGLDVALPYLAATYDERMFDALRTRAQVFEILTGGDPTADRDTDRVWTTADDEGTPPEQTFVPLPQAMLEDLRVNLGVCADSPQ